MSETKKLKQRWLELHDTDWLWPETKFQLDGKEFSGPRESSDYLTYFVNKYDIYSIRPLSTYKFGLLEKYKDNVVFSAHSNVNGSLIPYTVFQLEPAKHFITDWIWSESQDDFIYLVSLFITKPKDYPQFIREHKEFEVEAITKQMGFGGHGVRADD